MNRWRLKSKQPKWRLHLRLTNGTGITGMKKQLTGEKVQKTGEKAREPAAVLMTGEGAPVAKELLSGAKVQKTGEKAREPAAVLMTGEGPPVAKELLSGAKAQEEREPAKATVAKVASQPKVEEVDHLMSRANKAVQGGIWTQKPNSSSSSCYNHRDKSLQTRCGPIKIMGPNL
jgi:hypothetical protein